MKEHTKKMTHQTDFFDTDGEIIGSEFGYGDICVQIGKCPSPPQNSECRKAISRTEYYKDGVLIGWKIVAEKGSWLSNGECPPPPKKPSRAKRT